MYGGLWRILPGPVWLKIIFCVILVAAVVVFLFGWGFDWISPYLNFNDQTVDTP